ncbi:MAG: hypothetical protein IPK82_41395 [Polyangiaceae bacterium]|nr:hypothetical protein [Polyangiaceae bacterium]
MSLKVKALVLAAVAALAVSIVGCGGDEKKAETPPAGTAEPTAAPTGEPAPAATGTAAPAQ